MNKPKFRILETKTTHTVLLALNEEANNLAKKNIITKTKHKENKYKEDQLFLIHVGSKTKQKWK
jgi:hypothetical protein